MCTGILTPVIAPSSRIGVERVDSVLAVIDVEGEHDLNTAGAFRETLTGLLGEKVSIVVDLARASFVDSSILALLLEGHRECEEAGLGFAVSVPDDTAVGVRRVIEVTGLNGAIAIRRSRDQAAEAARTEAS